MFSLVQSSWELYCKLYKVEQPSSSRVLDFPYLRHLLRLCSTEECNGVRFKRLPLASSRAVALAIMTAICSTLYMLAVLSYMATGRRSFPGCLALRNLAFNVASILKTLLYIYRHTLEFETQRENALTMMLQLKLESGVLAACSSLSWDLDGRGDGSAALKASWTRS